MKALPVHCVHCAGVVEHNDFPAKYLEDCACENPRPRVAWWHVAACAHESLSVMFPMPDDTGHIDVHTPKLICRDCPVQAECRHQAIGNNEEHGIWGGLTTRERFSIKRGGQLRQCADCGVSFATIDQSSRARRCPHCQKPANRTAA